MKFRCGSFDLKRVFRETESLHGTERVLKISEFFLNIPYKRGTLWGSKDDKEILTVDLEAVDCMTLIEYVEALRISKNVSEFIENLKFVRYFDGVVDFRKRRHFFTDWDSLESIENVTERLGNSMTVTTLKRLNRKGSGLWIEGIEVRLKRISYIPQKVLFEQSHKIDSLYYCGFYASCEGLDVTHVGILLRNGDGLILRHASSVHGKVVDEPFFDYGKDKEGFILFRPLF